jgi:hypothetical protein
MKKKEPLVTQSVNKCPKCKQLMQRRSHSFLTTKILKQPFYFKEWDYCRGCKHLQHYEEFKVWNSNEMSEYVQMIEEKQEIDSLFKNL